MAGSSRVVDLYWRKPFRKMEDQLRESSRANMRKPIRRRILKEGDEVATFNKMLTSAITFFEGREDEVVDLPPDSPEKLTIEAVMGVLNQFKVGADAGNDTVRENSKLLSDKLRNMFEERPSQSSPVIEYINKLRESLMDLHNSVASSPDMSQSQAGPEGETGKEQAPEEKPEEPPPAAGGEAEGEALAKQLGLA